MIKTFTAKDYNLQYDSEIIELLEPGIIDKYVLLGLKYGLLAEFPTEFSPIREDWICTQYEYGFYRLEHSTAIEHTDLQGLAEDNILIIALRTKEVPEQ